MSDRRGQKPGPQGPQRGRQPFDEGPSFDASSLVLPPDAERELGRGPPRVKKKKAPIVPIAIGVTVLLVAVVVVASMSGGDGEEMIVAPIDDPALNDAPVAHGAAVPAGENTAKTAEKPAPNGAEPSSPAPKDNARDTAPSREAVPGAAAQKDPAREAAPAPSRETAAPTAEAKDRPRNSAGAKGKSKGTEEQVDLALERLAAQQPKSGKEFLKAGELEAARAAFSTECESKLSASCFELGRMQADGKGGEKDATAALASFDRGCDARSAESCLRAASIHEGEPSPGAEERALQALESACNYAAAAGCKKLAQRLESKKDDAGAQAKAIAMRARACALGDNESCDDKVEATETSTAP